VTATNDGNSLTHTVNRPTCFLIPVGITRTQLLLKLKVVKSTADFVTYHAAFLTTVMFSSMVVILARLCSVFVWWLLCTDFILLFPLHFPSCAQTCAITQQAGRTGLPPHIFGRIPWPPSVLSEKHWNKTQKRWAQAHRVVFTIHQNDGHSLPKKSYWKNT